MRVLLIISLLIGGIYGLYYSNNMDRKTSREVSKSTEIIQQVQAKEPTEPTTQEIVTEIARVFSPEGKRVVKQALDCFYSESKWNYKAININKNKTIDRGIAQLNSTHRLPNETWFDYKKNIEEAYKLYKRQGWKPWYGSECI